MPYLFRCTLFLLLFFISAPLVAVSQELPPTYPSHYFTFNGSDSLSYPALYPDQAIRDSIAANFGNSHRRAKAIEVYALKEQGIDFMQRTGESTEWTITLTGGNSISVKPGPQSYVSDYNFESYYPSVELVVFRAQWREGNSYLVVSRKTGNSTEMYGPPVFSPSKRLFVAFNGEEFTSYNRNGIQLFEITENGITKLIEFDIELAPSRVKWISDETFALEVFLARLSNEGMVRTYEHYEVAVRETKPE